MLPKVEGHISKREHRLEKEGDCKGFIEGWVLDKLTCCHNDFAFLEAGSFSHKEVQLK